MIADVRRLVQLALDLWDRSEPRASVDAATGQGGTRPSAPVAPPVIDRPKLSVASEALSLTRFTATVASVWPARKVTVPLRPT